MKPNLHVVCQFAFLSLYCILTAVRESEGVYVPGRCLCPQTQSGIRGQLKELTIYPKSATCSNVTVIVTLTRNNTAVCLDPKAPFGKQLIRCWNRAMKMGRDVKLCLKRRRRRGGRRQRQQQRQQQRPRGHNRRALSSDSQ
ncbi:C-X-C motif chemokine 9 [Kryptolebias marmoratus]|uniref:C-X-C motif chemokine 9-like n=1 Tax=Kryptolebias marmoratus TaxID=37003 RepID=A0A3Q3BN80_KRYMA|nr:C-X-C motif chemokine 9 [Kryptolebias marmoratus]